MSCKLPVKVKKDIISHRYQIVPPPDGEWGARRQDGSWTGMVGMVRNRVSTMEKGMGVYDDCRTKTPRTCTHQRKAKYYDEPGP